MTYPNIADDCVTFPGSLGGNGMKEVDTFFDAQKKRGGYKHLNLLCDFKKTEFLTRLLE